MKYPTDEIQLLYKDYSIHEAANKFLRELKKSNYPRGSMKIRQPTQVHVKFGVYTPTIN
jgi:hypothetical protein